MKTTQWAARILWLIALALPPAFSRADTVILPDGKELEGTIIEETGLSVVIKLRNGSQISCKRGDVDVVSYDKGSSPAPEPRAEKPVAEAAPAAKPQDARPAEKADVKTPDNTPLSGWTESWDRAAGAAKASRQPVLALFTGSDWCGWCKKLEKEVLATPLFQEWAKKNVVLLKVDFLRKTPQDPAQKKQNAALISKYKISGYPTVLILDAEGKELGRKPGYAEKRPQDWIDAVAKFITGAAH
jgi:protein disulfide-isomerase